MRVPDFLVRQFYVPGSLRHEGDGFSLQARNGMGDGTLVGIGAVGGPTELAGRLVEMGEDVVVFMDSLTRMSRAYNNAQKGSGRILSGGIDARTMEIHHGKHHAGYVNNLNAALEKAPELSERPLVDLLADYRVEAAARPDARSR